MGYDVDWIHLAQTVSVASCVFGDGSSYCINLGNFVTSEVIVEFVNTVPQV